MKTRKTSHMLEHIMSMVRAWEKRLAYSSATYSVYQSECLSVLGRGNRL